VKTESDLEHVNKGMVVDTKREEFWLHIILILYKK
jgi:hypothetical protein